MHMKQFIISMAFILAVLFITDRIGGEIMWWINQNTNDEAGPKLKYIANHIDEDIVLIGTSRSNRHYVSSTIADSTGMSTYNCGIVASNSIYSHYIVLNMMLPHHTPKVVCLEMSIADFIPEPEPFRPIGFFAPYIGVNSAIDSVFMDAKRYWLYHLCHLYRYNSKSISNIGGLFVNKQEDSDNGYLPLHQLPFYPNQDSLNTPNNVDPLKIEYIERFIHQCKSHNIELIFTASPLYSSADSNLYDVLKGIANKHNIPFFDYHTQGLFWDHPEYFYDNLHLWDKGARIFSSIFAHDLKEYLDTHALK